ncbi:hypothetical protein CPB86DRAFT_812948 [Serendipita vermifera]|nr:hypothetical protein CPB86DRAFT_812948 [Serendipita vermifera]
MDDTSARGRRNLRKKGSVRHASVPLEKSGTRFEQPVFGPSGSFEGHTNPLSLTNSNTLPETQERVGWEYHTHDPQQPIRREVSSHASESNCQPDQAGAAATFPFAASDTNYVVQTAKASPPDASSAHIATNSSLPGGSPPATFSGLLQVLDQLQYSPKDPVDDTKMLLSSLQNVLFNIGRSDVARHLQVSHPKNLGQQPISDGVESAPPQSTSVVEPYYVKGKDPDIIMNDQPEPARPESSPRMDSIGPYQDAWNFLRDLEEKWGSNRSTSFSRDDAVQLQGLFGWYKGHERERLTSLLGYSGNKVEPIRRAIRVFSELRQNGRGFIGEYNPQNGHNPSQLLGTHLVVKLRGSASFHDIPKPDTKPVSTASHGQPNTGTSTVDIPMTSGPNPNPSPPTSSAQVESVTETSEQMPKKNATPRRSNSNYGAPPQRPYLPHQHSPMPNGWPGQPQTTYNHPQMPLGPNTYPYPNPSFGPSPFYHPNSLSQPVNPGATPHGHQNMMTGMPQPWDFTNLNGNGYGYGPVPGPAISMGGTQTTAPPSTQPFGYWPGPQQPLPSGGFYSPVGMPHLPHGPTSVPPATPPQRLHYQQNMAPQPPFM